MTPPKRSPRRSPSGATPRPRPAGRPESRPAAGPKKFASRPSRPEPSSRRLEPPSRPGPGVREVQNVVSLDKPAGSAVNVARAVERAVFEDGRRADRSIAWEPRHRRDLAAPDLRFITRAVF